MKNIHRVMKNKENPYVMVNKEFIENDTLSWKAKGIMLYLLSRPDSWNAVIEDLIKRSTDGKTAVNAGLNELKKQGYIKRVPIRENGKMKKWVTKVYETPELKELKENEM